MVPTRVAAIDCGTNAIRLLIADVDNGVVHDVIREMRTVRLGEGVDATGEFSAAALERTFTACDEYANLIAQHSAGAKLPLRFIATSASRDVSNRSAFVDGVRDRLGVEPEVITGEEEATLSFSGALAGLPKSPKQPVLIADIGGGSTEFVLGDRSAVMALHSVPMGCVRMTERHLHGDPPTDHEIAQAVKDIQRNLAAVREVVPVDTAASFVGLAGSVTTIVAMALGLDAYRSEVIHGAEITVAQVEDVTQALLAMTRAERAALPFMHPGRIDVIGGGALVLREAMRAFDLPTVIASEADLLDGAAVRLA